MRTRSNENSLKWAEGLLTNSNSRHYNSEVWSNFIQQIKKSFKFHNQRLLSWYWILKLTLSLKKRKKSIKFLNLSDNYWLTIVGDFVHIPIHVTLRTIFLRCSCTPLANTVKCIVTKWPTKVVPKTGWSTGHYWYVLKAR